MCSSGPATENDFLKFSEISEKIIALNGANLQWIDEFVNISQIINREDNFHVQIEKIVCTQIIKYKKCEKSITIKANK